MRISNWLTLLNSNFIQLSDEFTAGQPNEPASQPMASQPLHSMETTPAPNRTEHSFFQNNSQLSQIPTNDTAVNRRLFGTPLSNNISNRVASTPFPGNTPYFPLDDEFENQPSNELNPRKRRLDDLFGDIDDIVHEEQQNAAQVFYSVDAEENAKKKARSEAELDNAMILRILNARAEHAAQTSNFQKQSHLQQLEALRKFKARNLSEIYPQWPSIPVVCNELNRIYVRCHSEEFEKNQLNEVSLRKNFGKLLGESSDDIWTEAQTIVEKRMTAAQSQANPAHSEIDEVVLVSEVNPNAGKLWVEKYRPKGYFDLLSDESTNRSLLTWLKMWDKIVFNKYVFQSIY